MRADCPHCHGPLNIPRGELEPGAWYEVTCGTCGGVHTAQAPGLKTMREGRRRGQGESATTDITSAAEIIAEQRALQDRDPSVIPCPRCSTTWVLDRSQVPLDGHASPECTRCGHTWEVQVAPLRQTRAYHRPRDAAASARTDEAPATGHATNIVSAREVIDSVVGDRSQFSNIYAYENFRRAAAQIEESRHFQALADGRPDRITAAQKLVTTVEDTLQRRLHRVSEDERVQALALLPAHRGAAISDRKLALFLERRELPSLKVMGHWLSDRDEPEPPELARMVRRWLALPTAVYPRLFELGQVRNVMAHQTSYELDRRDLGEAGAYLHYTWLHERWCIDIAPEKLERLRADAVELARTRALHR